MTPDYLDQFIGTLRSTVGGCIPGDKAIFRQHNLHSELKNIDWFDLYVYGITNRRFSKDELKLLQTMWVYTSYPDARIWNNRVCALAGSQRSTSNLAVSAALAVSEAEIFGRGIDFRSISFLRNTLTEVNQGGSLHDCVRQELKNHRSIAGFGRPLNQGDERIKPIMDLAKALHLDKGEHLALAFKVEEYLLENRFRLRMNYAAICSALAADMGILPKQSIMIGFPLFLAGMFPCYVDASQKPAGTLFPTPCGGIEYKGKEKRSWADRNIV